MSNEYKTHPPLPLLFESCRQESSAGSWCESEGRTPERYRDLSLALPKLTDQPPHCPVELQQLVDAYFGDAETVEYKCTQRRCKSKEAAQIRWLANPPDVLLIHVKRFEFTERGVISKRSDKVDFSDSHTISLSQKVFDTQESRNSGKHKFNLRAVIVHVGEEQHTGHYVTYVKGDDQFTVYDDSRVYKADTISDSAVAEGAYMIFYERAK